MSKPISCRDHDLNCFGLLSTNLEAKKPKTKFVKRGRAPVRLGAGFWQTIHVGATHPPAQQGEASKHVWVWVSFLLLTLDLI